MADNEKFILEQWADAFDELRQSRMQQFDESNNRRIQELYDLHGYGDWFTPGKRAVHEAALGMGLKYAILETSGMLLGSYVDVLRLGEVVRKPSVGAAVRDGLRLLTIVPFVGVAARAVGKIGFVKNFIQFKRLELAAKVPGSKTSCGPTALTRAVILSGAKMHVRIADVVKGMQHEGKIIAESDVLKDTFYGIESIESYIPSLERLGVRLRSVKTKPVISGDQAEMMKHFDEYAEIVRRTGDPIVVNLKHSGNPYLEPHVMLIYKDMKGAIKYADQDNFMHGKEILLVFDTITEAFQASNTAVLLPNVIATATAPRIIAGISRLPFWTYVLGAPVQIVGQNFMDSVEIGVRRRLKELNPPLNPVPAASPATGVKPKLLTTAGLTPVATSSQINSDSPVVRQTVYVYRVITGDTLFGLAKKYYGDAAKYKWIQSANADFLSAIQPHQQLPVNAEIVIPGN